MLFKICELFEAAAYGAGGVAVRAEYKDTAFAFDIFDLVSRRVWQRSVSFGDRAGG